MKNGFKKFFFWLITAFVISTIAQATSVRLANIFTDGCVLQRDQEVLVWGTGAPGETIQLEVGQQSHVAVVDAQGDWHLYLDPQPAGGPFILEAYGEDSAEVLLDVYFGDVWVLTGQSNMCQTLAGQVRNHSEYYPSLPDASDDFSDMRFAIVQAIESETPENELTLQTPWSRWQVNNLGPMSAAGYFFARELKAYLQANGMGDVPLGFIRACLGATAAEQWISAEALDSMKDPLIDSTNTPAIYYNGVIAPLQKFAVKGVLWYQAEANARTIERVNQYPMVFQTLVESWREGWGLDLPFYYVQLAPFMRYSEVPKDNDSDRAYAGWAWMREAQKAGLEIPGTGMVSIIDSGFQNDIHPPYKDRVGERLARLAANRTYGIPVIDRGPVMSSYEIIGSDIIITFENVGNGLEVRTVNSQIDADEISQGFPAVSVLDDELAGFALSGDDRVFYWAQEAEIISPNKVRISNAVDVPNPVVVRYAWQSFPRCNLFNSEGLPAEPFRTDDFAYGASTGSAGAVPPSENTAIVNFLIDGNASANREILFASDNFSATWTFRDYDPDMSPEQNQERVFLAAGSGTNTRIYGGLSTHWQNSNSVTIPNPRFQSGSEFIVNVNGGGENANNSASGILLWNKADFLNGADSRIVELDAGSTFRVNIGSTAAMTSAEFRFVVNQGGTYYVSDASTGSSGDWTLTVRNMTRWRTVSTDGTYSIGEIADELTLDNVLGVGLYFETQRLNTANQLIVRINEFDVVQYREVIGEGDIFPKIIDFMYLQDGVVQLTLGSLSPNSDYIVEYSADLINWERDTGNYRTDGEGFLVVEGLSDSASFWRLLPSD